MSQPEHDCGLIVFLRYPRLGKVKTRLAITMGQESALIIYNKLVSHTLETIRPLDASMFLYYEGRLPEEEEKDPQFSYHLQCDGHLGQKMADAMAHVLARRSKTIIIGSDCPDLTGLQINEAFRLLDDHDIVIGPAEDGGYYLIGCKSIHPFLFEDISWSTSDVYQQTIKRITHYNLTVGILPTLHDIDNEKDWIRFLEG